MQMLRKDEKEHKKIKIYLIWTKRIQSLPRITFTCSRKHYYPVYSTNNMPGANPDFMMCKTQALAWGNVQKSILREILHGQKSERHLLLMQNSIIYT